MQMCHIYSAAVVRFGGGTRESPLDDFHDHFPSKMDCTVKITEEDNKLSLDMERGAVELKAFALVLVTFVGSTAIGFMLAYGICRWGW